MNRSVRVVLVGDGAEAPRPSQLAVVEFVAVGAIVLLGWTFSVQQLLSDGWIHGGGTGWMFALSIIATLGAGIAWLSNRAGSNGWTAAGFALVAVSPCVFAYPLNVVVLILALVETGRAMASRRHSRRAGPRSAGSF